jgi:hypothetical protein
VREFRLVEDEPLLYVELVDVLAELGFQAGPRRLTLSA